MAQAVYSSDLLEISSLVKSKIQSNELVSLFEWIPNILLYLRSIDNEVLQVLKTVKDMYSVGISITENRRSALKNVDYATFNDSVAATSSYLFKVNHFYSGMNIFAIFTCFNHGNSSYRTALTSILILLFRFFDKGIY